MVHAAHGPPLAADDLGRGPGPPPHHPPQAGRLADTINQQGQTQLHQLQGWLDRRGLAPHAHSHQAIDSRRRSDLERLSRVGGTTFDLAFLKVMTARQRAASKLAATEAHEGSLPEVRQLARQLLAQQQAQIAKMTAWKRAWFKASPSHPPATAPQRSRADGRR